MSTEVPPMVMFIFMLIWPGYWISPVPLRVKETLLREAAAEALPWLRAWISSAENCICIEPFMSNFALLSWLTFCS